MYQKIRLQSKRNNVHRIIDGDMTYISKEFSNVENLNKEIEILEILYDNNCKVPKILKKEVNTLILEDLGDFTLLKWYEQQEKISDYNYDEVLNKLSNWLESFYQTTSSYYEESYIIWDVNFRNFIINNDEIYGIDFEQSMKGCIVTDLGKLIAYGLTYDPIMTCWKKKFAKGFSNILSDKFKIDDELIEDEINNELIRIIKRRNIDTII